MTFWELTAKQRELLKPDELAGLDEFRLTIRAYNGLARAGFCSSYGLHKLRKQVGKKNFDKIMKMLPGIGVSSISVINSCLDAWEYSNKEVLR